ncbi:TraC protein [Moraxella macacae 0408225]|uniref:TraC protein n=2 Tax=Moraxella macacae TaxID=765840 RepID=L2F8N6_9GAMM|nr:TraC protein [Moraxella macacae 0408225]
MSKHDDYIQEIANDLIEQIKNNNAVWQKPWQGTEHLLPVNHQGKPYSGINVLRLLLKAQKQGYGDNRWFTYNNAKEQGGQVKRGEKATSITFYVTTERIDKTDANGKVVLDEKGKPIKEEVKLDRPKVVTYNLFNAQQIDGLPPRPIPPKLEAWERHAKAEAIIRGIEKQGLTIVHQASDRAYYSPQDDRIVMPERSQFATADLYYATLLHEIGHATGHESRLNRDLSGGFGSQNYAKEELRAEISSMIIGQQLQIGHDPSQHHAYLQSWVKAIEEDPKEIFRAVKDADKISDYVMGLGEELEVKAEYQNDFEKKIDDVINHNPLDGAKIVIGNTPEVFKMLGVDDKPVYIHRKTILKDAIKKHNVTAEDLKQLPKQLESPIAIMNSSNNSSNPNAYVVLTSLVEYEKNKEKPIIIALDVITNKGAIEVTSVYGRRQSQLENDLANTIYWNKEKGQKFVDNFGYQLPPSLSNLTDLPSDIKTNDDLSQYILQKNSNTSQTTEQKTMKTYQSKYTDEQLSQFSQFLNGEPITAVSSGQIKRDENGKVIANAKEYMQQWLAENRPDGIFHHPQIGDVNLFARGVKDSISHYGADVHVNALPTVPYVLENSVVIDKSSDKGGKNIENYILASPIKIDDENHYAVVRLKKELDKDKNPKFYIVSAETETEAQKNTALALETRSTHDGYIAGGKNRLLNILHETLAEVKAWENKNQTKKLNPNTAQDKTYLYVPYEDKDRAKQLGAKWDKEVGSWYAPIGSDLTKFSEWRNPPIQNSKSHEQEFGEFLSSMGADVQGMPIMDGRWHRVHIDGDKGKTKNANYVGWLDGGKPRGYFKNFKTGETATWVTQQKNIQVKSLAEIEKIRAKADEQQQAIYDKTAYFAKQVFDVAPIANNHPYLTKKGVQAHNLRLVPDPSQIPTDSNIKIAHDGRQAKAMRENFKESGQNFTVLTKGDLLIPAFDKDGKLTTFQTISSNTNNFKSYLKDGQKSGSYLILGEIKDGEPVLIAEGYATGATLHEQLNRPVIVAFDSGNLMNTALAVREKLPNSNIYLMADNDHQTEKQRMAKGYTSNLNSGIEKATEASRAIGGYVIAPTFSPNDEGSDFNDLYKTYGFHVFKEQIKKRVYEIKGIETDRPVLQSAQSTQNQEQQHDPRTQEPNPRTTQTVSRHDSSRATTSHEHSLDTQRVDDRGGESPERKLFTSEPRLFGQPELIEKVNQHPTLSQSDKQNIAKWADWLCQTYQDSPDFIAKKINDLNDKIPDIANGKFTLPNFTDFQRQKEMERD